MPKTTPKSPKSPAALPLRPETWQLTVRKMSVWVEMDDGLPAHPYLTLLANLERELILGFELAHDPPGVEALRSLLWRAMFKPERELRQTPHRPQTVDTDLAALVDELTPALAEIGVELHLQAQIELLDELVSMFEDEFGEDEERPDLLSVPGADPELVGDLYAAAAEAYRQAPWIFLSAEQPVKFSLAALDTSGYVQLMGNSAIEYGLLLYHSWEDVEQSFLTRSDAPPTLPATGWVSLNYGPAFQASPGDLEAIQKYGWPVAAPDAYPIPMILFEDRLELPDLATLQVFIALLRALPPFVAALQPDLQGDYAPLELEIPVLVGALPLSAVLEYPAGELHREAFPALISLDGLESELDFEDDDQEIEWLEDELLAQVTASPAAPDDAQPPGTALALDTDFESLADWEASPIVQRNPALVQAMALIYNAWDEDDPAQRIQLCRQALALSPDCAEAYVMLAEDLAVNLGQALKYYQKGVEAGERALGPDAIQEHAGRLWELVEARPLLRAHAGATRMLWELERLPEALERAEELLRLDRADALHLRYAKLLILFEMGRFSQAHEFMHTMDDPSASWQYTAALLEFRNSGDSAASLAQLQLAMRANPHVPDYLSGRKRLPVDTPQTITAGHNSEAIDYAAVYLPFWRQAPGVMDWLRKHSRAGAAQSRPHEQKKHKRR